MSEESICLEGMPGEGYQRPSREEGPMGAWAGAQSPGRVRREFQEG